MLSIKEQLLKEHSRSQTVKITRYVGKNQDKFNELMRCVFSKVTVISQRASPVMYECGLKHPVLMKKWHKKLIMNLSNPVHDAVKRNTVRLYQFIEIPASDEGILNDQCFQLLKSEESPIAIKAFALTVIGRIAEKYPELKNELALTFEQQRDYAGKGLKSRAAKVLKLNKE